jgi:hypothetical protein
MVQVSVGGVGQSESPEADVVESLVVNAVRLVGVLDELPATVKIFSTSSTTLRLSKLERFSTPCLIFRVRHGAILKVTPLRLAPALHHKY